MLDLDYEIRQKTKIFDEKMHEIMQHFTTDLGGMYRAGPLQAADRILAKAQREGG